MAHAVSDDKKDPGMPDGAAPGTAYGAAESKHDFDADARARARESADVTIGGIVYHRRRKNWDATRALRRLLREQEHAIIKTQRLRKKIDALDPDAPDDEVFALEAEIDEQTDVSDEKAYGIIVLLLRDGDGQSPSVDHLKEHLDVEEAGDLAANLANGGEPDPTPTTPSSSTS
jgi:hypothetical protein